MTAATGAATVYWYPPTHNEDGSPLTDLAGFHIHYGQARDELSQVVTLDNPGLTSYVIENLAATTWYFAVQAYASSGMHSGFSNIVSKKIE